MFPTSSGAGLSWATSSPWTLVSGTSAPAPAARATSALYKQGAWSSCTSPASPSAAASWQAAGMQTPALRVESGHHQEPSWHRDWNKINVIMLPCFPVQKLKGDRFLSPVTCFYFNSTGRFPSGVLGGPCPTVWQFTESRVQNPEPRILIQQLSATDINLVICKKVGWNFCCCCCSNTSPSGNLQLAGVRFIIWHKGNCQDFFFNE